MKSRRKLKDLEYRHFQRLLGERFKLCLGKDDTKATLVEVVHLGPKIGSDSFREPFSLILKLGKGVAAEPGVHGLEHKRLGRLELLMTPVAFDRDGSYLEVVFA